MVATLINRRSSRILRFSTTSPSITLRAITGFCSMKIIAIECPMFGPVARFMRSPPSLSSSMFTCGRPVSESRPWLALITLSPVTIFARCSLRVRPSYGITSNDDGRSSGLAIKRNSNVANLSSRRLASELSCTPGKSMTILDRPRRCTRGSATPSSLIRLRSPVRFCSIATSSIVAILSSPIPISTTGLPCDSEAIIES